MTPDIYRRAAALVDQRKAATFSQACSMLAQRRKQKAVEPRQVRLPYKDD